MQQPKHLHILWTTDNLMTVEKMVFMYAVNALRQGWWEHVTLIIWGAAAQLAGQNAEVQEKIEEARQAGVHVTACKACADQLGVSQTLESLGIEVKYWGKPLTDLLQGNLPLLTL